MYLDENIGCPFATTTQSFGITDVGFGLTFCRNDECEWRGVVTDEELFLWKYVMIDDGVEV